MHGENACHSVFIHFRKTIEKKLNHFCGFLRTVEQTGDKKNDLKIKKNAYHNFYIWKMYDWHFFDGDTKFFLSNFEKLPRNVFIEIAYNFLYVWNCMELYEK